MFLKEPQSSYQSIDLSVRNRDWESAKHPLNTPGESSAENITEPAHVKNKVVSVLKVEQRFFADDSSYELKAPLGIPGRAALGAIG